jgi:hypothetical protein
MITLKYLRMSNLVKYSGNNYERIKFNETNHRGQGKFGQNMLNNQLKMAEIEAGHLLRDNIHSTARGKKFNNKIKKVIKNFSKKCRKKLENDKKDNKMS